MRVSCWWRMIQKRPAMRAGAVTTRERVSWPGSAAWYDGARGVLSLVDDPDPESNDRLLQCVKANYGRTGWGARLTERTGPGGAFRGLELGASMDRPDLEAAKRPAKPGKAGANGAGKVDPTERAALDAL